MHGVATVCNWPSVEQHSDMHKILNTKYSHWRKGIQGICCEIWFQKLCILPTLTGRRSYKKVILFSQIFFEKIVAVLKYLIRSDWKGLFRVLYLVLYHDKGFTTFRTKSGRGKELSIWIICFGMCTVCYRVLKQFDTYYSF